MTDRESADKDDDVWLDALRGRPPAHADDATVREAQDLRHALLAQYAQRDGVELGDKAEQQRLLFRLRREGLLAANAASSKQRWRVPLAAAAVIALAAALIQMLPDARIEGGGVEVLRGAEPPQTLIVDDVGATAQKLESVLREAGATVSVLDVGGGAREVAATVPIDQTQRVARELAPFGLQPPLADGTLRIEIRLRPQ